MLALRRSAPLLRPAGSSLARAAPLSRALRTSSARFADEPAGGEGLSFTFALPGKCLYENASVEMVILPGSDGQYAVMPNHVATISELKPGVVAVQEEAGGPLQKYFISGGFSSVNPESKLNLSVLEACELEDLDADAVKTGLAQYSAAYDSATDDYAKSEAEIGVEVYQAMSFALADTSA